MIIMETTFVELMGPIVYYLFWGMVTMLVLGLIWALWYFTSFPYKITVWPLYGSGKDGVLSFGQSKSNRARFSKDGFTWILMYPIFTTKECDPFDSEFVYPGKNCYAFDLNGCFIPARINIHNIEGEIDAQVNPIINFVSEWEALKSKKVSTEGAQNTWWVRNKLYVYCLMTMTICVIFCATAVYLSYGYVAPTVSSMERLVNVLNHMTPNSTPIP